MASTIIASAPRCKPTATSLLGRLVAAVIAIVCVVIIYAAPVVLYLSGSTLSGFVEESVGYRYFYSLRMAFGHEHPWLPQGQLPTLFHVLIQHALSWVGLPENQLFPRVDIFDVVASAGPGILAIFALYLVLVRLSVAGAVALAAGTVVLMTSPDLPMQAAWAIMPDYHVWVLPIAFAGLATLIRVHDRQTARQWGLLVWAGGLGGLATAVKLTFVLFSLPAIIVLIAGSPHDTCRWRNCLVAIWIIGATAILVHDAILWAYYGRLAFLDHFNDMAEFVRTNTSSMSLAALVDFVTPRPIVWVVAAAPFVLLVLGLLLRSFPTIVVALTGALSLYLASRRLYSHTLIEVNAFAAVEFGQAIWLLSLTLNSATIWLRAIALPLVLTAALATRSLVIKVGCVMTQIASNERAYARWREALGADAGPIQILTTENPFRLNSIESALCKGGMNIFDPRWGVSPYIAKLFPNFKCAVSKASVPLGPLGPAVGFIRMPDETLASAVARVESYFSISLAGYGCGEVKAEAHVLVYCRK